MERCSACCNVALRKEPTSGNLVRLWTSYNELDHLAQSGCDICALCRQYLTNWWTHEKLCNTPGDIRLYASRDHLTLECPSLDNGLNLFTRAPGRPRTSRTAVVNDGIFKQARQWLCRCLSDHRGCTDLEPHRYSVEELLQKLPRRLIDVASTTENEVALLDCADCVSMQLFSAYELAEWCTLSYRWGSTSHSCMLREPFEVSQCIQTACMPQTFKDALAVARELGIPFLWIDALCIVQIPEGNSDWQRESVRMGQIYENAICTIAATSAVHAHEGFIARTGRSVFAAEPCLIEGFVTNEIIETNQQPHCVEIETSRPDFFNCVSNSPLNQRGWVMQERALSKRILHFTEHGLFWECSTLKANDWCGEYEIQDLGACRMKESMMSVSRAKRTQHLCPVEWFHFIKQYSRADFSRFQDRLIALSSVARAVQPVVKSKYLAGLWSNDLIRGLEWYVYRPDTVPRGGKAPTWSWASVTGAIDFSALGLNTLHDKLVDVLDVELLPMQGMDVYGDLQQGNLTIKGTLTTARLPKVNRHEIDDQVYWDEPHMDGNVVVAEQHDLSEVAFGSYTVLPTGMGFRSFSVNQKLEVGALILEPVGDIKTNDFGVTESVSGKYRRKGWMLTDEELLWSHISKKEGRVLQTNMRIYRGMSKIKSMGISWKELNPVEVCII